MNHPRTCPIVTPERQQAFEQAATLAGDLDTTPTICGYYGRACYQMNSPEGANRCLCYGCPLKAHCADDERRTAHDIP